MNFEPEYIAARRVLLDALEALGPHRDALILVGAQAIYLHVGDSDMAVAPFTTDGDLTVDPDALADEPDLVRTLEAAGFVLTRRPGTWTLNDVDIDFMVPTAVGGAGRRGARLGAHGNDVARKANGLEAVLVDHSKMQIESFDTGDSRSYELRVPGVASLLVAKLHKINERKDEPTRLSNKDGLDVLRLLRFAGAEELAATLATLAVHPGAGGVTREARLMLEGLFGKADALGSQLAVAASEGLEDEATIAASCEALARRVLSTWQ